MEYVRIEGVHAPVSRVVLGTDWLRARSFRYIAGRLLVSPFVDEASERANFAVLDGVLEAGCTAFDTARSYPDSERSLGTWLQARGVRERVVLITKGAHPGPRGKSRLSPSKISRDLERSLRALRTDYIDIYLLHYDDERTDVRPVVDVLNRHVESGKIRALGVSNWGSDRIARALEYARSTGRRPFTVSSLQFSLPVWQGPPWPGARTLSGPGAEADRRWHARKGLWILAYSSLAMGFFSPSRPYASGEPPSTDPQRLGDKAFLNEANLARLGRAKALAQKLGVSPGRVALAWVLGHDPRMLALVGARSVDDYVDAAAACQLRLSAAQRTWLRTGTAG